MSRTSAMDATRISLVPAHWRSRPAETGKAVISGGRAGGMPREDHARGIKLYCCRLVEGKGTARDVFDGGGG